MKTKRWREAEALYRAALACEPDQRQAFLADSCRGDEELLREVESLLGYDARAQEFLEIPAVELEAKSMAADSGLSLIGQQLSHYKITEKIGSGGMGDVYRARDTRLGRDVAIKVSSDSFSERFEREARLVAALNHPRICTLHDVGSNYLVMELVEGPTLAERIQEGPIPIDESLRSPNKLSRLSKPLTKRASTVISSPATLKSSRMGRSKCWISGWRSWTQCRLFQPAATHRRLQPVRRSPGSS